MLDWRIDDSSSWYAQDDHYRYRVAVANTSSYVGYIYEDSRMVYSQSYPGLREACRDLEHRGRSSYFVHPEDEWFDMNHYWTESAIEEEPVADKARKHTVTLYVDPAGEYRWTRRAANGEPISNSTEGYSRKDKLVHGMRLANQDDNYVVRDLTEGTAQ